MSRTRFLILGLLMFGAVRTTACRAPNVDSAMTTVHQYDLVVAYGQSSRPGRASLATAGAFSASGEVRRGLRVRGTGSVVSPPVRLTRDSVLQFEIGVTDGDGPSGGVEFSAFARRPNSTTTKLFSRRLDPAHEPRDRQWVPVRIPLRQFGTDEVSIVLSTRVETSDDATAGAGVWADPQIILPVNE